MPLLGLVRVSLASRTYQFGKGSTNLLKAVASAIIEHLTYLINLSLKKSTFAERLKKARIFPLHKGGF